ncbi:unnamed protein product [Anisakis simplex]|uniref:Uncharacterized protein n=2 Tax=Anisakis simplex TaxID=6269 RepID=A0A3P6NPQ1_ANISI|nr:unnamed protein product [Anisakis simplex]
MCDGDSMISNAYYDVRFDENYAAPHRDVERISHLLQKSQSSLEGAFRPDARSVWTEVQTECAQFHENFSLSDYR